MFKNDVLGNVEICWRTPNFLKFDTIASLRESALTCWLTLWGIKMYWLCSLAELTLILRRTKPLACLDSSSLPLFLILERKTCEVLIVVDRPIFFW